MRSEMSEGEGRYLEMTNSVMEVISSPVATVATPQNTELGELKTKVASLRRQLSDLQVTGRRRSNWRTQSCSPPLHTSVHQAGK